MKQVTCLEDVRAFTEDVMVRADAHAKNIREIFPVILAEVMIRHDPGSWWTGRSIMEATIGGSYQYIRYDGRKKLIEVRTKRSGQVLAAFDNTTPATAVRAYFSGLKASPAYVPVTKALGGLSPATAAP